MVRKPRWKEVYEHGVQSGLDVYDCHTSVQENGHMKDSMRIQTPFTYQGESLKAFCEVVCHLENGHMIHRPQGVEFWTDESSAFGSRNVEDILEEQTGIRSGDFQSPNGPISSALAACEVAQFAGAASEYPHVMTCSEYLNCRKPVHKRMQLDEPTERDYENYLDSMTRQLSQKDITFIGKICSVRQIHDAYQTMPSFEQGMTEWMQSVDSMEFE